MIFKICSSLHMSGEASILGSIEDRLIRVPEETRKKLGIDTGLFLWFNAKEGDPIALQVAKAYTLDALKDPESVYVSRATYDELLIDVEKVRSIKPADNILVGCDPEFFIVDMIQNKNISASHFFSHYGELGSDQGLAELRPRPSFKESEVTKNIEALLAKAQNRISTRGIFTNTVLNLIGASYNNGCAAGFHIHFGLPSQLLDGTLDSSILIGRMVNVLDYYVGIPSIMPEGEDDYLRRSVINSQYGKPGDHRWDLITLEYRVPGGHLLRHPILTSGLLSLCIVVMKDLLSRLKIYTDNYKYKSVLKNYEDIRELYPSMPNREKVWDAITSPKLGFAVDKVHSIIHDVSSMIGYGDNSLQIVSYFDYILNYLTKGDKYAENIANNWRLAGYERQQKQMEVLQASN
jgi:bifunctional DNA-binding transcriptional regulator/antitoxin component of YhaV-PrlF toxin-antitoxin module